ncbi:MAG: GDP-mannose 4,6-dehydratase [Candidatus Bathyarchaeota archaeon]
MGKTMLITGGAGFIGSNFVRYWYEKYPKDKIIVLDNLTYAGNSDNIPLSIRKDEKRFEFWYGNVCNGELVGSLVEKSDIVVHFAAESHVARSIFDNKIFYETDVLGTQAVATAVVKHYRSVERFIHISTSEVYGTAVAKPMDENHPLNPCSPYASAKCGADRLVYSFIETYDIPAVILRPFNQYGPYQHLEKVIARFITSALYDEPLTVHGDGSAKRDWLYVEDTCHRIEKTVLAPIEKVKGEVFNLGSGESIGVLEIANKILEMLNKPKSLITFIGDRLGQVQNHISSTEKARKVLGIEPGRAFEEGLQQTIGWYRNNEEWWRRIEWMKHIRVMAKSGKFELH